MDASPCSACSPSSNPTPNPNPNPSPTPMLTLTLTRCLPALLARSFFDSPVFRIEVWG